MVSCERRKISFTTVTRAKRCGLPVIIYALLRYDDALRHYKEAIYAALNHCGKPRIICGPLHMGLHCSASAVALREKTSIRGVEELHGKS